MSSQVECHPERSEGPRFWLASAPLWDKRKPRLRPSRTLLLLERRINPRIGTHPLIRSLRPTLHREIGGINPRHAALPHHNLAKDVAIHGHRPAEELVFPFIR